LVWQQVLLQSFRSPAPLYLYAMTTVLTPEVRHPWEVPSIRTGLEKLREVLQTLEPLAEQAESGSSSRGTRLPTLKPLCGRGGLLQSCLDIITRLDRRLKTPAWSHRFGPKRKALVQALRWPLNEAETKKTLQIIDRFTGILKLAIVADQTYNFDFISVSIVFSDS